MWPDDPISDKMLSDVVTDGAKPEAAPPAAAPAPIDYFANLRPATAAAPVDYFSNLRAPQYTAKSPFVIDPKVLPPGDPFEQWKGQNPGAYYKLPNGTLRRVSPAPAPEEAAKEQAAQYDPTGTEDAGPSTMGSAGRGVISGALPAAAGMAGMGAGAQIGAAAGVPFAPVTAGLSIPAGAAIGAIGGGLLAGYGAGKLQDVALDQMPSVQKFLGQDPETRAADEAAHPYASFAGRLAPQVAFMRPSLPLRGFPVPDDASAALRILGNKYTGPAVGGALGAGQEAIAETLHGEKIDPAKLAMAGGAGAVLTKPWGAGDYLMMQGARGAQAGIEKVAPGLGARVQPPPSAAAPPPEMPPVGSAWDISMVHGEDPVRMTVYGYTKDGRVILKGEDGDTTYTVEPGTVHQYGRPVDAAPEAGTPLALPPPATTYGEGFTMRPPDGGAPPPRETPPTPPAPPAGGIEQTDATLRQAVTEGQPTGSAAVQERLAATEAELQPDATAVPRGTVAGAPAAPEQAAAAPQAPTEIPPGGYRTAKGSVYEVHDDGTTSRNKSFHPEHGAEDQGPQPRSTTTFYVNREDLLLKLAQIQATNPLGRTTIAPVGDGQVGVVYADGPHAGKFIDGSLVTPTRTPQPGLYPVEVFDRDGARSVHFGNEITEVAPRPEGGGPAAPQPPEPQAPVVRQQEAPAAPPAPTPEARPAPAVDSGEESVFGAGAKAPEQPSVERQDVSNLDTTPPREATSEIPKSVPEPTVPPTEAPTEAPLPNTEESKTTPGNAPTVSDEKHTKTGKDLFYVRFPQKPDIEGLGARARLMGGQWQGPNKFGVQPGWRFTKRESADRFAEWARKEMGEPEAATPEAGDYKVVSRTGGNFGAVWWIQRPDGSLVGPGPRGTAVDTRAEAERALPAYRDAGKLRAEQTAAQPETPLAPDEHPGLVVHPLETGKQETIQPPGTRPPPVTPQIPPLPGSGFVLPSFATAGAERTPRAAPDRSNPQVSMADAITQKLGEQHAPGVKPLSANSLQELAELHYGSKLSEGKFTRAEIYDALELGVNRYILANDKVFDPRADLRAARQMVRELEELKKDLPTQTVRAGEKDSLQQFSTPPDYAFAAAWMAKIGEHDVVLEPSAGTGSLVAPAMNAKPKAVIVNELSKNRAPLVESLAPDRSFRENAEQLHGILPADVKPTVVVMNPPFSQTAGRMGDKTVLTTGAQHVEQALKRLEPGGRLVAIVGRGMRAYTGQAPSGQRFGEGTGSSFRGWWNRISGEYDVRANVGVPGEVYGKYGTNFGTQLLVIDKNPPSGRPSVIAEAESIPDLMDKLNGVRDERAPAQGTDSAEQLAAQPSGEEAPGGSEGTAGPVEPLPGAAAAAGVREGSAGDGARGQLPPGTGERGEPAVRPGPETGASDALVPEQPQRGRPGGGERDADQLPGERGELGGGRGEPDAVVLRPEGEPRPVLPASEETLADPGPPPEIIRVQEEAANPETAAGVTENVYEPYKPQRITIKGAAEHPTKLVQSAAMASVMPPEIDYRPKIPAAVIKDGKLSAAQLEAITYAGHAHSQMLPEVRVIRNGSATGWVRGQYDEMVAYRRGYFIGDGTGVGKGAQVAGIMLDNWAQGRKKALWVSESRDLIKDARRDWSWVGRDPKEIFDFGKLVKPSAEAKMPSGIGFMTYDTMARAEKTGDKDSAGKSIKGKTRVDQIVEWLGKDFDGVIAFDESHNLANSIQVQGTRGSKAPAQKALAGIELQQKLPNARVVYVSATGATEVMNLAYAERLGLWGPGTAFPSKREFISQISSGGVAAMELVARDMKAMGNYIARSLSYDGVEYDRVEHKLTGEQRQIYDDLAGGWQEVLQNIEAALIKTAPPDHTGEVKPDKAQRLAALSAFWGAHQRFFNQIITSMQMPSVIKAIEGDIKAGRQAVVQLVNTNEASQKRALSKARAEESDLEDLDMTPKDQLMQLIDKSFPTAQIETWVDANGNEGTRKVTDSAGNIVDNPEALAMKDALLTKLGSIRVPYGPLELLLNHFGIDNVAEITGRKERVVKKLDKDGQVRTQSEARPGSANITEADAFQDAKKKVLVFSQAGMTGKSYHADLSSPSAQARRSHYMLQSGWRADKALQGLGRSHRTNQASAPIVNLVTTDLQGQKRFISSIARRLAQLGALTKGERRAGESGLFSARDNLESTEARTALASFWRDLQNQKIDVIQPLDFERQTGLKLFDQNQQDTNPPEIPQFLNRLLSLKFDMQNRVFDEFSERLNAAIDYAAATGTLDVGTETLKADRISKAEDRVVHTDPQSGAETRYVKLKVENKTNPSTFEQVSTGKARTGGKTPEFYVVSKRSGKIMAVSEARDVTDADGRIREHFRVTDPLRYDFTERSKLTDRDAGRYWDRIDDKAEAKKLWDAQVARLPEYMASDAHLITGAILPIWDRLGQGMTQVYRLQTDAGEKLLGRTIADAKIDGVLKALGAETGERQYAPADVAAQIMAGGRATLANGWHLRRSTVAGQPRIELVGPNYTHDAELSGAGVFTERIGYSTRYFVPSGEGAAKTLESVLARRPVTEMVRGSEGGVFSRLMSDESGAGPNPFRRRDYAAEAEEDIIDQAIGMGHNGGPRLDPNVPRGPGWSERFFNIMGAGPRSPGRGGHYFNPINRYYTAPLNAARYNIGGVSTQKWNAEVARRDDAARLRSSYVEGLPTYLKASKAEHDQLMAVLELERLQGRSTPADGRSISADNAEFASEGDPQAHQPHAYFSKPGETLKLTDPKMIQMYGEYRRTMDKAWGDLTAATAERYGWEGEPTSKAILAAAEDATGREARRLTRIARMVGAVEYARRTAYVPFMRFGDYSFHVLPKEGTDGWNGEGKRPTAWFGLIDSRLPEEKMLGGRRKGSLTADKERARLEQMFDPEIYEIREGYFHPTEDALKEIGIPAIEKLFTLMGNDNERMWRERARTAEVVDHPGGTGYAIKFADGEFARAPGKGGKPGDILQFESKESADARAVTAEASKLQEQAIESILGQVYREMEAGFKKRARNTPGYDRDLTRSTGTYLNWIAHNIASIKHRDAIDAADAAVAQSYDKATRKFWQDLDAYQSHEDTPLEGALRKGRNAAFYYTIGLNAASTMKNMLDGPLVHLPALSAGLGPQGGARAAATYANAQKDILKSFHVTKEGMDVDPMRGAKTPAERALIRDAEAIGLLTPHGMQELAAIRQGGVAQLTPQAKFNREVLGFWGSNMAATDRLNRTAMLLASYRTANRVGMDRINRIWGKDQVWASAEKKTPEAWARFMVDRVAGVFGDHNRSPMMRNVVGASVLQFTSYSQNYLSTMYQLFRQMGPAGAAAGAMMLAGMSLLGGLTALPFVQDAMKAAEMAYRWVNDTDTDLKTEIARLSQAMGFDAWVGELALHGVSRQAFGIDLGSLGLGNFLSEFGRGEPWELLGPMFGILLGAPMKALQRKANGESTTAILAELLPSPIKNALKGTIIYPEEGVRTLKGGTNAQVLTPQQIGRTEQIAAAVGFPSATLYRSYEAREFARRAGEIAKYPTQALHKKLEGLMVRQTFAQQRGDSAEAARLGAQIQDEIARGVARGAKPNPETLKKAVGQAINPQLAPLKQAPKAARPGILNSPYVQP